MRKKRSYIWKILLETLQEIINESNSYTEVLQKLGFNAYSGNHRTLKERIRVENINCSLLEKGRKKKYEETKCRFTNEEIFIENSTYPNKTQLKKKLINLGLKYECQQCNIGPIYNNIALTLQLDHINGINNDNRIVNLRFLCPNCHSQTNTFSGKKNKKICKCEEKASKQKSKCKKCNIQYLEKYNNCKTKIDWPTPEVMSILVWGKPSSTLAKELGVSDVAINKFCKIFNISKPPRGYWSKQ